MHCVHMAGVAPGRPGLRKVGVSLCGWPVTCGTTLWIAVNVLFPNKVLLFVSVGAPSLITSLGITE